MAGVDEVNLLAAKAEDGATKRGEGGGVLVVHRWHDHITGEQESLNSFGKLGIGREKIESLVGKRRTWERAKGSGRSKQDQEASLKATEASGSCRTRIGPP